MAGPRRDTRGIVEARELFSRVRFRRREPAQALRPYLEHYWLIDWDLPEPYASHVVPHPCVNIVFQRYGGEPPWGEVAGIGLELFTQKLEGEGRVCGVQFRPGGYRPFAPQRPVSDLTGRRVPIADALPGTDPVTAPAAICGPDDEDTRVAALDAFLLGLAPEPDPRHCAPWNWWTGCAATVRSAGSHNWRRRKGCRPARCNGCSPPTSGWARSG